MTHHQLKTHPTPFQAVWDGLKLFEFRENDRNFKTGDILTLLEYDQAQNSYSRRKVHALVTFCLYGGAYGVPVGYAVLSINPIRKEEK